MRVYMLGELEDGELEQDVSSVSLREPLDERSRRMGWRGTSPRIWRVDLLLLLAPPLDCQSRFKLKKFILTVL